MPENLIRSFLSGETDILSFRERYEADPAINAFLQDILDRCLAENRPLLPVPAGERVRDEVCYFQNPESYPGYYLGNAPHGSVREYLTQEFGGWYTTNVRTAYGALRFYHRVYDLYYQHDRTLPCLDEPYQKTVSLLMDILPDYIGGEDSERYIQEHILPQFPETLPATQRKKALRAKIREEFPSEKGYPAWVQSPEWPLGKNGTPATYLGKKKARGSDLVQFRFRDESDGSVIVVEQCY